MNQLLIAFDVCVYVTSLKRIIDDKRDTFQVCIGKTVYDAAVWITRMHEPLSAAGFEDNEPTGVGKRVLRRAFIV